MIPIVYSEKFYKDVLDPLLDDVNKLSKSNSMMEIPSAQTKSGGLKC